MNVAKTEHGSVSPWWATACGVATAALAYVGPMLLESAGNGWLVSIFGPAAPVHVLIGGAVGMALAGLTVGLVLACLKASQPAFLGAWAGTTLLRLAGLGVMAILPVGDGGATQGLLMGYVAAVVLGSMIEVPAIWIFGTRGERAQLRAYSQAAAA